MRHANAAPRLDPRVDRHTGGARQRGGFISGDHVGRIHTVAPVLRARAQQSLGLRGSRVGAISGAMARLGSFGGKRLIDGERVHALDFRSGGLFC